MADVIPWPRHRRYNCTRQHEDGGWTCPFCAGALFFCTTCKSAEGELTTDCPGGPVHEDTRRAVLNGQLDFKSGKWICVSASHRGDGA